MSTNKSKKKILLLINDMALGGAQVIFIRTANFLKKEGYDVYLCLLYSGERSDSLPHLDVESDHLIDLNFSNLFDVRGYLNFLSILKVKSIDTLYATLDESNFVARVVSIFAPKIKVTIREANIPESRAIWFSVADIFFNVFSDNIIATSKTVQKSLLRYEPFFGKKIKLLENSVDVPDDCVRPSVKEKLIMLSVGALQPKKGYSFLLNTCAEFLKDYSGWELNVIGAGSLEEELKRSIENNGLSSKITLLGSKKREQVLEFYRSADIFILPSEWEGGPNVLLEAMSYGLPCVSTRVGFAEDKIKDGLSGFLVDYGDKKALADKVTILLNDVSIRSRLGAEGRKVVILENSTPVYFKRLKEILSLDR